MSSSVSGQTISGAAKVGGIAGNPIGHSLSPVIHNAWIAAAGMDAAYVPFAPADEAGFAALVAAGRAGLLMGINVTAPFKEQAFALADSASGAAKGSGSANVLVFRDGQVACDSTDGFGMMWAISDQAPGLTVKDRPVVILGAGGAARAAAGTLIGEGAQVRILNRSRDRAEALAADLGSSVTVVDEDEAFDGAVLVINALSIKPALDLARLAPETAVMDMTYRPVDTEFLLAARARGLRTVDGLGMLIGQAGPSFRAIFGVEPPALPLRPLLLAAIEAQK
ncbi:shikimate dehydrogenase family protein [Brevundimonas goettingensis]|uniref:Shikimate dehydrogenase (NADP(+)) n=1 Tax=Brevundimonas goettingensis TaxID=2774190 RepID=A0A975GV27_9CAUL|nr:shikimate dehydrogenase [Brevundimonas goettingensis]QTC90927.1 shikimate dehydrogenase [Brevundimonas goettingensis]